MVNTLRAQTADFCNVRGSGTSSDHGGFTKRTGQYDTTTMTGIASYE